MFTTHKRTEHGVTHRTASRSLGTGTVRTACGYTSAERDAWAAGQDVTCKRCLKLETCDRGHIGCGTPEMCAQLAAAAPSLSLEMLRVAAIWQGIPAEIVNTGGGVMALSVTVDGGHYLIALDYGHFHGSSWCIATDDETREALGELESPDYPVTSDADQTIADAVGWVRADHGRADHADS